MIPKKSLDLVLDKSITLTTTAPNDNAKSISVQCSVPPSWWHLPRTFHSFIFHSQITFNMWRPLITSLWKGLRNEKMLWAHSHLALKVEPTLAHLKLLYVTWLLSGQPGKNQTYQFLTLFKEAQRIKYIHHENIFLILVLLG